MSARGEGSLPPIRPIINPEKPETPVGLDGIIERFGDIRTFVKDDGTLNGSWTRERMVYVPVPWKCFLSWAPDIRVKRFQCHVEIVDHFRYVIETLDDEGVGEELTYYGGGFNFRGQRGSGRLSTHAWIIAWDFNPQENQLGTQGNMNPRIVEIFELNGFVWGGRFERRPDPMHFQFARGY